MKNRDTAGFLVRALVLTLLLFSLTGCDSIKALFGLDDNTLSTLQNAIDMLGAQPGQWQTVLTTAEDKLGEVTTSTARAVLADVQALYTTALGQTESAGFCGADFIGIRVRQKLQGILHKYFPDKAAAPDLVPVICLTQPEIITARQTQQVKYYGFDFNAFDDSLYSADLMVQSGELVRRNFGGVRKSSNYLLVVDIQGNSYAGINPAAHPYLALQWKQKQVNLERWDAAARQVKSMTSQIVVNFAPTPTPTRTPTRTPTPTLPPVPTQYEIKVHTGDRMYAGTDADVFMQIYGTTGNSPEFELDTPGHDDFERNHWDTYVHNSKQDLGKIRQLRVWHKNNGPASGWFLDRITVKNRTTNVTWNFPCNRWFATDEDDHQISRMLFPDPGGRCQ